MMMPRDGAGNVPNVRSIIPGSPLSSARFSSTAEVRREAGGPHPARPPTIVDVAERAGVSKSVVSRVMRGERAVSAASREAVLAAAESLGYRPNAVARSLVQRRTFNVGVMISDLHNIFFAEVLDGLGVAAAAGGYRVLITTGNRDRDAEAQALEQLLQLRADGIVLAGARLAPEVVAAAARSVPVAVVGSNFPLAEVDVVVNDDVRGGELAVEHLAGLGHVCIAMIDGGEGAGAGDRRAGYESAMLRLGLGGHLRVEPGDFTEAGGREGIRRLLGSGSRPTAVFASNDLAAVGALNAVEEAGYEVPRDVSLVGYDNTALAALRHISLTTINQPRRRIGELAMAALLRRIAHPRARASRQVLPPELVVRATTAPPR
jgi:DNA-binding LacI/PurR family transcriptional regulator